MTPDRRARLQAIAAAHDEWEGRWLIHADPDPAAAETYGPDYQVHYLDVSPPLAAEQEWAAMTAGLET